MKIDFRGNDFIVFLNSVEACKVDFLNKRELEKYFRKIFLRIKKMYDIEVSGSYDITVYINSCNAVLDIKKDDIEYSFYYDDSIDMKITLSKYDKFLYKIDGGIDYIKNKCTTYLYNNEFYVQCNNLSFIEQGILLENSTIIYGSSVDEIMNGGTVVRSI